MDDLDSKPTASKSSPLSVIQPNEKVISEIRRHPAGLLRLYLGSGLLLIILAVLAFITVPDSTGSSLVRVLTAFAFFVILLLAMSFVFVSTIIFFGNYWVLTSDSITQTEQQALFRKRSSQLSLENLEDVSAEKNSFLATLLGYGDLKVETAGEREKFVLNYCPNPDKYAKQIIDAREVFQQGIKKEGEGISVKKTSQSTIEQLGQAAINDATRSS